MSGATDELVGFPNDSGHAQRHPYSFFNECFYSDNIEEIYDSLEVPEEPRLFRPEIPQEVVTIDLEAAEAQADREEQISNLRLCIKPDSIPIRNAAILPPFAEIESFEWKHGELLSPGMSVELRNPEMSPEPTEHTFLVIKAVVQNLADDSVKLRGWKAKRTRDLGGLLPKRLNEVAFIHEIDADDNRPLLEQSVIEVDLGRVLRTRKLVCTNKKFPECRFNPADVPHGTREEMKKWVEDNSLLVARWSYISNYQNKVKRVAQDPTRSRMSAILRMLTREECTKGEYINPDIRRLAWRGPTVLGGASKATQNPTTLRGAGDSIAEAKCDEGKESRNVKRTYTFGDCCKFQRDLKARMNLD
jgi:DNA (cytosine-5)-methyltransferase 1